MAIGRKTEGPLSIAGCPDAFGVEALIERLMNVGITSKDRLNPEIYGVLHLLRDRWGFTWEDRKRLPNKYKPLGEWYSELINMCVQLAAYDRLSAYSWAHSCIAEIALYGGVGMIIEDLYPLDNPPKNAFYQNYMSAVVSRMASLERPARTTHREICYFNHLLEVNCEIALNDKIIRDVDFKRFTKCTRALLKSDAWEKPDAI